MADPYRDVPAVRPSWNDYFDDYALAFGLCRSRDECGHLDPPEFDRAARYADWATGKREVNG